MPVTLSRVQIDPVVRLALQEDAGGGDITTELLLQGEDPVCHGQIRAKESLVLAGLAVARRVFELLDPDAEIREFQADGEEVQAGTEVLSVRGRASAILIGERTALNFLGRLCGIATLTRRYRTAMGDSTAKLLCTRKTTPLLRALELHAVSCGGGTLHRRSLHDGVLIKDNHRVLVGGPGEALRRIRHGTGPAKSLEVEVDDLGQLEEAIQAGADVILLDNFSLGDLKKAVETTAGRSRLEASGGVNLESIGDIAATGIDAVSVGALTHSAPSADLNLTILLPGPGNADA